MENLKSEKYFSFFKSIIEQDSASIVICNTQHDVVYMNPAAIKNYSKFGGEKIIGQSIFDCHNAKSVEKIKAVVNWFLESTGNNKVHTFYNEKQNKDVYMIALRGNSGELIGYYEKHEFRTKDDMPFYEMA